MYFDARMMGGLWMCYMHAGGHAEHLPFVKWEMAGVLSCLCLVLYLGLWFKWGHRMRNWLMSANKMMKEFKNFYQKEKLN